MLLASCSKEAAVEQTGNGANGLRAEAEAVIRVTSAQAQVTEGVPISFTVELSESVNDQITVEYEALSNTATAGADYDISKGTLTFKPGETSKIVTISTTDDADPEAPEEFIFVLSSPIGGALSDEDTVSITVVDNDTLPNLSIVDITVNEGSIANFTVSLDTPSGLPVTFDWSTSDDNAVNGDDYTASSGVTTTIPAGQSNITVSVPVLEDTLYEDNETFRVTLSNVNNATGLDVVGVATIADNDVAPTINIDSVAATEGSALVFTVTASAVSAKNISVDWTTVDGTATSAGGDFTAASNTLTILAGQTTGTITISSLDNAAYELAETMTVSLSNNINSIIGTGSGTGTINDNDTAPTITIDDVVITEGDGDVVNLTVTLSATSEVSTSVNYNFTDDTAVSPDDYTASPGTLTIPPLTLTGQIGVTVINDNVNENVETLDVALSGAVNATISDNRGIVTINDNDPVPELSVSDETAIEGNNLTFTVSLNTKSGRNVSFDWASVDGTALSASDYTSAFDSEVTIPAGTLSTTFSVTTTNDVLDEPDSETLGVTLSNPTNATINDANGIGTITDNDASPSLSISDANATEGGSLSFTVTQSAASARDVDFDWATSDGTATLAASDYVTGSGTITISAGATSATILVNTNNNTAYELDENLSVTLSNPINATIADNTGVGTINDDDTIPKLSISDTSIAEGVGASLTVTKTGSTEVDLTFSYATADATAVNPTDYLVSTGTGTILAANPSTTISVTTVDDTRDELSETIDVNLSSPVNATIVDGTGVITLLDNDLPPVINISDAALTEGGDAVFTVSLSEASDLPVSFDWATGDGTATIANNDYTTGSESDVTIPAGSTSTTITITTNDDAVFERAEDFSITLSNTVNATDGDLTGFATITDNDLAPTLSIDSVTVNEGSGVTFTVTLSSAAESDVTFDWATADGSATVAGGDYLAASGTTVILSGATTATINITTSQNIFYETDETFTVVLSNPTNATISTGTGVATINDDDAAPSFAIDSVSVTEAGTGILTVTKTGNTQANADVAWITNPGTATVADDYTAASGILTFLPGDTTKTISIVTVSDVLDEFAETLTVDLSSPVNATITTAQGTITINDDDAEPTLSIDNITIAEGASSQFTVTLSAVSGKPISVNYSTNDGSAVQPDDYTSATGTVNIPAGSPSGQFTVTTLNEGVNEGVTENFTAVLNTTVNATIGTGTGTATINEVSSVPTLSIDDVTVTETGTATFTVTLSAASLLDITFDWTTVDGTAIAGSDYTANSASDVTIVAGNTTSQFTINSLPNAAYEIDETYTVVLSNASNATIADGTGVGTITDDDPIPTIAIDDVTVTEGTDSVYTVTKTGSTEYDLTVGWSTAAGTATVTDDFTNNSGTLTILAANSTGNITITTIDDSNDENDENFAVTLSGPTNASITTATGTTTLQDNDALPQLSISDVTTVEGSVASFVVSQDVISQKAVSFDWATSDGTATLADSDYTQVTTTTETIPAGAGSITVNVTTAADTQYEGASEDLSVTISNPLEATILDNTGVATLTESLALPAISVSDVSVTEGTDPVATFTVSVDHTSDSAIGFTWETADATATTANSDYVAVAPTLGTIAPGTLSTTVNVTLTDNAFYELTETFNVNLSLPTNGTISDAQGVATITDNEVAPSISINDVTVTEGVSADFTVTVTGNTQVDLSFDYITVDGTANNAPQIDYTAFPSTGIIIPAGTPTATISIPTNDDAFDESDSENFTVVLSNPVNTSIGTATGTATINDNDALPFLTIGDITQIEGGTATFTVTASAASGRTISFDWTTSDGTALNVSDYTTSNGVGTTIAPYATTTTLTVPLTADSLDELDDAETYNVTLSNLNFADPGGSSDLVAVGTITDQDISSFSINDQSIVEGATGTFTVSLNVASEATTSVNYSTLNATATAPADYTTTSGTITLTPGLLSDTFTVTTNQNTDYEINETFHISLSGQVNASITKGTGIGTITDDEAIPTLAIDDVTVTEGGSLVFTVTQTNPTEYISSFDWAAVEITTVSGSDYTATPATVTITPPATSATITIPTTDDTLDESIETLNVNLSNLFQATASDGTGQGTINDNDNLPNITISDATGNEGDSFTFTITIDAISELPVSVDYVASSGTASAGVDFTNTTGTATIAAGNTTVDVVVPVTDDGVNCEIAENFTLDLSTPVNGVIVDAQGLGTITDNDPLVSIDDPTVAEGGDMTFTISIPGTCGVDLTVDYATADATAVSPTDYTGATGTATITAGFSTGTITIPTFDDGSHEGDETFSVAISNLNYGLILDGASTATITDANAADFSINDVTVSEADGTATFTISLADPSTSTLTVDWTTNNATAVLANDYSSASGTATFTPGTTTQNVIITILEDTLNEATETFTIDLSNPSAGSISDTQGIGTINDNDALPTLSLVGPANSLEGTVQTFIVNLSTASGQEITYDWVTSDGTALAGSDYTAGSGSSVKIPAGSTSSTFTVTTLVDGGAYEGDEFYNATISNPNNATIATATDTGTITDNDVLPTLSIDDVSIAEGGVATFTVTLSASSAQNVTFDWTTVDGTALAASDFTTNSATGVTILAGNTTATFDVTTTVDAIFEGDETYTITLSNPSNATISDNTGIGTILDDEIAPTLSIDSVSTTEGGSLVFTVTQSAITLVNTTVDWTSADGTASSAGDYTSTNGTLTIPAGLTTDTITVTTNDDTVLDALAETMTITLSNPTNATIAAAVGTGTINDNEPIKINSALGANGDLLSMKAAPDNSRILYIADGNSDGVNELYAVNPDGSNPSKINTTPVAGGDVISFEITSDSSKVVFMADRDTDGMNELYSADLDGSNETKISPLLTAGETITGFALTPNSSTVVYVSDQDSIGEFNIYSMSISGGDTTKLNSSLPAGGDIDGTSIKISADNSKVVFMGDATVDTETDVYSASIGSTDSSTKLTTLPAGGNALKFDISNDSSTVVYIADEDVLGIPEIYSIPIAGGASARRINTLTLGAGQSVTDFKITPNSASVVYIADETNLGEFELFAVAISDASSQVKLNTAMTAGGDVLDFDISGNSDRVIYIGDKDSDGVNELFSVAITGGANTKLNAALTLGGDVLKFKITPDSLGVIYIADQATNFVDEAYITPINSSSPTRLNADLPSGGDINEIEILPNSTKAIYLGDQATDEIFEIFSLDI